MIGSFRLGVIAAAIRAATSGSDDPYASNVVLLLHCDGTNGSTSIVDNSQPSKTADISCVGNAAISTTQKKFGTASIAFDGTGDSVLLASGNVPEWAQLNAVDFTIEGQVYRAASATMTFFTARNDGVGTSGLLVYFDSAGALNIYCDATGVILTSSSTVALNTWAHVAVTRALVSGTWTWRMFINGTQVGSTTGGNFGIPSGYGVRLGASNDSSNSWNGYLDEVRITRGVARYTSGFTAPTAAFSDPPTPTDSSYSNVLLLLHLDGTNTSTTIVDNSPSPNAVTCAGNAQIRTAQKKFGTGSIYLDGSGDYLAIAPGSVPAGFDFSGGDFTIEGFVYKVGSGDLTIFNARPEGSGTTGLLIYISSSGMVTILMNGGLALTASTAVLLNTWTHVAIARAGSTTRIFVGGVLAGSTTGGTFSFPAGYGVRIGSSNDGGGQTECYLDEYRITKDVARYTAAFTPPIAPFPNSSSTQQAFSYTGADQTFVVPAGVTSITVRAWGAGGGSNGALDSQADRAFGGPGGFVKATLAVTPGETLTVKVGGGGKKGTSARMSGGGGGRSELLRSTTPLVIAGAGGGSGGYGSSATSNWGGKGGGTTGGTGGDGTAGGGSNGGAGGTQSAGGAQGTPITSGTWLAGPTASGLKQGGDSSYDSNGGGTIRTGSGGWPNGGRGAAREESGGGGGDGYYGGGGGGGTGTWGNGGGGGSSYTDPAATSVTHAQGTNTSGSGTTAPGTAETGYVAGVALGGFNNASGGVDGGNGLVVITW